MQINALSVGYADPGAVGRHGELATSLTEKGGAQGMHPAGPSNAMMGLLAGVVSQYDLSDITPRDFSEMLRELKDAGAITEAEFGDLAQIRLEMDAEGFEPDDSLDLLDFYRKAVERAGTADALEQTPATVAAMRRRLNWLEKVAAVQESPGAAGMNVLV